MVLTLTVHFDQNQLSSLKKKLASFREFMTDQRPVHRELETLIAKQTKDRFDTQSMFGSAWRSLSPFTYKVRQSQGQSSSGRIMDVSGTLKRSVGYNGRFQVSLSSKNSLTLGTRVPYARMQQETTDTPITGRSRAFFRFHGIPLSADKKFFRKPARPFLGWEPKNIPAVTEVFAKEIIKRFQT